MRWRATAYGLATVLGVARRGFFIPARRAEAAETPAARAPYDAINGLFAAHEAAFLALIEGLERHAEALGAIGRAPPPAPRWDQDWFPRLDAALAFALVRERRPRYIVEVGSGHSTRFLAAAAGGKTRITAIDPAPRAALDGLDIERLAVPVQEAGLAPFAGLGAGDVLFIDSSHVLMPGSDVDVLINRVIPGLPAGVLIHLHDVFLPDDYPRGWAWRGYNEQLAVAALLTAGRLRPLFASHYAATRLAAALGAGVVGRLPLVPGAVETSLWVETR